MPYGPYERRLNYFRHRNIARKRKRMVELANMSTIDFSEYEDIVTTYRAAVVELARCQKVKDDLNKAIKGAMGANQLATISGVPALKLAIVITRRFDETAFREAYPELHSKYVIEGTQQRLTVVKSDEAT